MAQHSVEGGFFCLSKNLNGKFLRSRLTLTFSPCFVAQGQHSLRTHNINTTGKKRAVVQNTDALCTLRKTAHYLQLKWKEKWAIFRKSLEIMVIPEDTFFTVCVPYGTASILKYSYSIKINTFLLNLFGEMQVRDTAQFLSVLQVWGHPLKQPFLHLFLYTVMLMIIFS